MTRQVATTVGPSRPPRSVRAVRGARWGAEWPLSVIFVGMPLWWVLGGVQIVFFLMAIPMAAYLLRRRDVLVLPGFGVWLLFLVWVLGGVFVIQVDAPGAITGGSSTRYLTFAYRFGWYAIGTIALLYVTTRRKALSTQRIGYAISWMFVALLGGGLLGNIFPYLEFPSLLESLLPNAISSHSFVNGLIHPQVAQVHTFLGYEEARPSAPFAFTNEWGLSIAATFPFFLVSWWRRGSWHRLLTPVLAGLALVPIVSSLNRGLWLALLTMAVFAVVRIGLKGHINALALMVCGLVAALAIIATSPFGDLIMERINTPHSNEGRTNLSTLAVESTFRGSPVMGFGTTRDVQGNFTSIAGGATEQCPACSPPALGTQGQLWLLIFGAGFPGLMIFVGFFLAQLRRHLWDRSAYSIAAACSIIACLVTMPVYNSVGPAIFICLLAVGVMHREGNFVSRRRLSALLNPVRRNWGVVVASAVLGAVAGGVFQFSVGVPSTAAQSVLVPRSLSLEVDQARPLTMDSEGILAQSGPVLEAVAVATGVDDLDHVARHLRITADPNTRILNLSVTDIDPQVAETGAAAAATAFLDVRDDLSQQGMAPAERGQLLRSTGPFLANDRWIVAVASGLMLGVVGGTLTARAFDGRLDRLRRRPEGRLGADLPTLARLPSAALLESRSGGFQEASRTLGAYAPLCAVLADEDQPVALQLANALNADATESGALSGTRVLLVASTRSRSRPVRRLHRSCVHSGLDPVGLILVEE